MRSHQTLHSRALLLARLTYATTLCFFFQALRYAIDPFITLQHIGYFATREM